MSNTAESNPMQPAATIQATVAEGAQDHASKPVPLAPQKTITADAFKPRRKKIAEKDSGKNTSLPRLLRLTGRVPLFNVEDYRRNTFIPSTIAMQHSLDILTAQMMQTHRFIQSTPGFSVFLADAFVGLLFYIHIFRIERAAGLILPGHNAVLKDFEEYFALDELMVPGVCVPFFKACGISAPSQEQFDDIHAALPESTGAHGNRAFLLHNDMYQRMPNVLAALDQHLRLIECLETAPTPGTGQSAATATHDKSPVIAVPQNYVPSHFYREEHTTHNTQSVQWVKVCPNMRKQVVLTKPYLDQMRSFGLGFPRSEQGHYVDLMTTTTNAAIDAAPTGRYRLRSFATADVLDWYHVLGLKGIGTREYVNWVGSAAAAMQRMCQFVHDSVPLSHIPVTCTGESQICVQYTVGSLVVPVEPANWEATCPIRSLAATMEHVNIHMSRVPLVAQLAAITQVNATGATTHDTNVRTGPIWTVTPVTQRTTEFDMGQAVASSLIADYHSDTRLHD